MRDCCTLFTIYTALNLISTRGVTAPGPARVLAGFMGTHHISYDSHTYLYLIIGHISGGYTFPLGLLILLMGKRAALRPLMPPSAAALTGPCCAPPRSEPCSGRISETRAQLPTLLG